MNKKQHIDIINKRADEYAESGQYRNYQEIENQLSQEGFREAKNELNDRGIRDKLDELCRIARSPEESERRNNFRGWLQNTALLSEPIISKSLNNAQVVDLVDKCALKATDCTITLEREFGSTKIKATSRGYNKRNEHFTHKCELEGNPTFDTLDSNDLAGLLTDLYKDEKTFFEHI